jgi:hypothetical protein
MMSIEGPFLTAIIARLDAPITNLAAFGIAFAFAIIIESPVIMLMSASAALVEDRESYFALRRFSYGLSALLTLIQLIILTPPVFNLLASGLSLPDDVAELTHGSLALMLPWTTAIGYRRFRQGLLIRNRLTRRVAYGTVVRLVTMLTAALATCQISTLPGAYVGAIALSAGVILEAIISRMMTAQLLPRLLAQRRDPSRLASLRLPSLLSFYTPLALTSLLALASQPTVTFFMGQSRYALESLAVLPVIHGLTFIFRSVGLSYLEVVITLIGCNREHYPMIRNFALVLGFCASAGLGLIAFTPLAVIWFRDISGLSSELTAFALTPTRILVVLPAFSVLLAFQRGLLVRAQRNASATWATLIELISIATVLTIGIHRFDLAGAVVAASAIITARVTSTMWLMPTCWDVLRRRPKLPPEIFAPPAPQTQ